MITFKKKTLEENLMKEAIDHLTKEGVSFDLITAGQADSVSKVNSKAMVLTEFKKTTDDRYSITIMDKGFYNYTRKLLEDYCGLKIVGEDKKARTFTAETSHIGIALDVVEVLGLKYNLSIVKEG